jgi:putative 4-mercaptohistidine N1-methyltranferase
MNFYETDPALDEYLLFHYGSDGEVLPHAGGPVEALHFPVRSVVENVAAAPRDRALDLGCAVGRSSFEMSRFCAEVIGLDQSRRFIAAAEQLRRGESLRYRCHVEGRLFTELEARRPEEARPEVIRFQTRDALDLEAGLGTFDLIHCANLLCRLTEPQKLVGRLPSLVRPAGILILTTPCSWLEEFTPPANWPAGSTIEWLKRGLTPGFSLLGVRDQPFLIREHARKYQWSVAQASVWGRRP